MSNITSSSLEVSQVQEELVQLNLKIKIENEEFSNVYDKKDMEIVNEAIRGHLSRFRSLLDSLKRLAHDQRSQEARQMLLKDVENHHNQLVACQKQFRFESSL